MPAFYESNKKNLGIQDVIGFRGSNQHVVGTIYDIIAGATAICNHPYEGQNIKGIITFRITGNNLTVGGWEVRNLPQGTINGTIGPGSNITVSIPIDSILTRTRIELHITITAGTAILQYPRFIVQEIE